MEMYDKGQVPYGVRKVGRKAKRIRIRYNNILKINVCGNIPLYIYIGNNIIKAYYFT